MKENRAMGRRDFIKFSGMAGVSAIGCGFSAVVAAQESTGLFKEQLKSYKMFSNFCIKHPEFVEKLAIESMQRNINLMNPEKVERCSQHEGAEEESRVNPDLCGFCKNLGFSFYMGGFYCKDMPWEQ